MSAARFFLSLLALSVGLIVPVPTYGAPDPEPAECRLFQARSRAEANREALQRVDTCAALPGLSPSRRAEALIDGAEIRSLLGDRAAAERALTTALELRPGDPDASLLMAELGRDRPEQALAYALKAGRGALTARRRAAAFRLAADIQVDLGDAPGAGASLEKSLEAAGDDLEALRAMVRLKRAQPAQAAVFSRRACEAAAAAPLWCRAPAFRLCAQTRSELEDPAGAMAELRRALDVDPDDLTALKEMLRIRSRWPGVPPFPPGETPGRGRAPGGTLDEPAALRALEAEPDDLEALRTLVEIRRAEKNLPEAVTLAERFTASIRKAPSWQQGDAYRVSSEMWLQLGDPDRVINSLVIAHRLDPGSLAVKQLSFRVPGGPVRGSPAADPMIVKLRLELGDPAGAEGTLARSLKLLPDDLNTLQLMVEFKLSQGQPRAALSYAERLLAASEGVSLAEIVRSLPSEDLFPKPGQRSSAETVEGAGEFYLKDAGVEEVARLQRERLRLMAVRTIADVELELGHPEVARRYVDRFSAGAAKAAKDERPLLGLKLAQLRIRLKEPEAAETALKAVLADEPGQLDALEALLSLMKSQRRPKDALAVLGSLEKASAGAPAERRASLAQERVQLERWEEPGPAASGGTRTAPRP